MKLLRTIFEELRNRRFPAILAIYCAGGFALLEAIDDLSGRFGWPGEIFDVALVLLLVGILHAGIAAWFHGAARTQRWERRELALHLIPVVISATIIGTMFRPAGKSDRTLDPNRILFAGLKTEPDGQAGQQFGDSLSADISAMLSGATGLRVEQDTISGPASLLSGRIIADLGKTRISVELSEAESGIQLWSERFERDSVVSTADRLQVASSIALSVTKTLRKHFRKE